MTNETKLREEFENFLKSSGRDVSHLLKRNEDGEYSLSIIESAWIGYKTHAQEDAAKMEVMAEMAAAARAFLGRQTFDTDDSLRKALAKYKTMKGSL